MVVVIADVLLVLAAFAGCVFLGCAIGWLLWTVMHAFDRSCPCGKRWVWWP